MTTRSEARRSLSRLSDAFGTDEVLMIPKPGPGSEGPDLVRWADLPWPLCRCGSPTCPDYVAPDCDVCAALIKQREDARLTGDGLTVRNSNQELRYHLHVPQPAAGGSA
ncbi:hypothetical protein [Streptomyces sp. NPDC088725]|uniref:hypothetical protein n=1 Tax=Streptomyces sp. NPDC088725 TaxID=3365873 RepID=UPI00382BA913